MGSNRNFNHSESDKPMGMMTGWWCDKHLQKYEFVNGKDDIPYMKCKLKKMFETTNQMTYHNTDDGIFFSHLI